MTDGLQVGSAERPPLPPAFWRREVLDQRAMRWIGLATSVALVAIGWLGDSRLLELVGIAGAVAVATLIARESLLALFVVAGAVKGAPGFSSVPVDLTVLTALLLIVALVVTASREGLGGTPMLPAVGIAAALAALVMLSVLWSPDPQGGIHKALRFETFNLLALVAPLVLLRSREALVRLAIVLVALGLFVALTAVSTNDPSQPRIIPGGDEIELGINAAVGLIAAVTYLALFGPLGRRILVLVASVILAQNVVLSGSRGAVVSTAVALAYFVAATLVTSGRLKWLLLTTVVAVFVWAAAGAPGLSGPAAARYRANLFTGKTTSVVGSRSYLLERGWEIARDHPFGIGAAGFNRVTNGLNYPHNIVLEFADEQGIIGVALFLALVLLAWRARLRGPGGPTSLDARFAGSLILLFFCEALFSNDIDGNRALWFALGVALAFPGMRAARTGASS